MANTQILRGFATILEAAKKWYVELLGIEPYFETPGGDTMSFVLATTRTSWA